MIERKLRVVIDVIGIAAVVGSLLLVAYQIQQANRIAQATTVYEIVRDINEFNDMGISDNAFAGLLVALSDDQTKLSEVQSKQTQLLAYRFLNIWITQEVAYRNDLFTKDQLTLTKADVLNVLADYPKLRPFFLIAMKSQPGFADYEVLKPLLE